MQDGYSKVTVSWSMIAREVYPRSCQQLMTERPDIIDWSFRLLKDDALLPIILARGITRTGRCEPIVFLCVGETCVSMGRAQFSLIASSLHQELVAMNEEWERYAEEQEL
jgi:hypothetical protein